MIKPRPAAPISFNGIKAPFQGTINLDFLNRISNRSTGSTQSIYDVPSYELNKFQLDPGIYWIVHTGSCWAYCDGQTICQGDDQSWVWESGTRDLSHGPYDPEWNQFVQQYLQQYSNYPESFKLFWE